MAIHVRPSTRRDAGGYGFLDMGTFFYALLLSLAAGATQDPGYSPYSPDPHFTYGVLYPTAPHSITVQSESVFMEQVFVEDHDKWYLEVEPHTVQQFPSLANVLQYSHASGDILAGPSIQVPSAGRRVFTFQMKALKVTETVYKEDKFRFIDQGHQAINDGTGSWFSIFVTITAPSGQGNEPPGGGFSSALGVLDSKYHEYEDNTLWFGHTQF